MHETMFTNIEFYSERFENELPNYEYRNNTLAMPPRRNKKDNRNLYTSFLGVCKETLCSEKFPKKNSFKSNIVSVCGAIAVATQVIYF